MINENIIVQKYGGSSVSSVENIKKIAEKIKEKYDRGYRICVVLSAMHKTTNNLLKKAFAISKNPSKRELDMLLSCGERVSISLLAMALSDLKLACISLTGSQSGIITNNDHSKAKILEVRPKRVLSELAKNKIVIIAGFQGVSFEKEITTLGRGGSDITAIAMAAAINSISCEIFSDVPGVFSADPNLVNGAKQIPKISFEKMEKLSLHGAKVLNFEAIALARKSNIIISAKKTGNELLETIVGVNPDDGIDSGFSVAHEISLFSLSIENYEKLSLTLMELKEKNLCPKYMFEKKHKQKQESILVFSQENLQDFHESRYRIRKNIASISLISENISNSMAEKASKIMSIFKRNNIKTMNLLYDQKKVTFLMSSKNLSSGIKIAHKIAQAV